MKGLARLSVESWLEQELWAADSDSSWDGDHSLVWKGELFIVLRGCSALCLLFVVFLRNVAEFFLDGLDDFELCSGGEALVALFKKEFLEVGGEHTSSDLHLLNSMWNRETFEDWDGMGHTIS